MLINVTVFLSVIMRKNIRINKNVENKNYYLKLIELKKDYWWIHGIVIAEFACLKPHKILIKHSLLHGASTSSNLLKKL
jgi:hypothetical protein